MIAVLAVAATLVWADLLVRENTPIREVSCPRAPADVNLTPLPYRALRGVAALPPGQVAVLVRNSTSKRGLAGRVAARLELLGFDEASPPDNDPVYATGTMHCTGQIRFGPAGRSAARGVRLVAPCAQLVRDDRSASTVDLVLGTSFTSLERDRQVRELLRDLGEEAAAEARAGGLQSVQGRSPPYPNHVRHSAESACQDSLTVP